MQLKNDSGPNEEKRSFDSLMAEPKNSKFQIPNPEFQMQSVQVKTSALSAPSAVKKPKPHA
jgi:hypothetical protein